MAVFLSPKQRNVSATDLSGIQSLILCLNKYPSTLPKNPGIPHLLSTLAPLAQWILKSVARGRLSLKSHSISIDRLCAALACYRGPLLNLKDVECCPPELRPLSEYLGLLASTAIDVHRQVRNGLSFI